MTMIHDGRARRVRWAGAALLVLAGAGCGPRVGSVSGRVLYDGRPLPSGTVLFFGEDSGRRGFSPIAADGTYRVENVPPGPVKIAVVSEPRVPPGLAQARGPGSQAPGHLKKDYVLIPAQYGDPDRSGLKITVEAGRQSQDILLKPR